MDSNEKEAYETYLFNKIFIERLTYLLSLEYGDSSKMLFKKIIKAKKFENIELRMKYGFK